MVLNNLQRKLIAESYRFRKKKCFIPPNAPALGNEFFGFLNLFSKKV